MPAKTILFLPCAVILISSTAFSQYSVAWGPLIPVTTATQYGNARPRISLAEENNPLVTWGNKNTHEIFVSRWNGSSFDMPLLLNPTGLQFFTDEWAGPGIAADGDTVYITMKGYPENGLPVYMVRSFDGGQTFSDTIRVFFDKDSISRMTSVGIHEHQPMIVFMKYNPPGETFPRYVYKSSSDGGNSFTADINSSSDFSGSEVCDCCPAEIVAYNNYRYVMFRGNNSNTRTIWVAVSDDNGQTFVRGTEIDRTNTFHPVCPSTGPDGMVITDSLFVVWRGLESGKTRNFIAGMNLDGTITGSHRRVNMNVPATATENYPRISGGDGFAGLVWQESYSGRTGSIFSFSSGGTTNFGPLDTLNNPGAGMFINPDIAYHDSTFYVVYQDNTNGGIYFRKGTIEPASGVGDPEKLNIYSEVINNLLVVTFPTGKYQLSLVSAAGDLVYQESLSGQKATVELSALSPGVYFGVLKGNMGVEGFKVLR